MRFIPLESPVKPYLVKYSSGCSSNRRAKGWQRGPSESTGTSVCRRI